MSIFDLLLIAMFLGTAGVLLMTFVSIFLRRWALVRRSLVGLLIVWVVYLTVGTVVAMMTSQRTQAIGTDRCFDEMCFNVTGFRRVLRIGESDTCAQAHGIFYIVDVRVSNRSRGRTQRERGRKGMLIDKMGRQYDVSAEGMRALTAVEGRSPDLSAEVEPGGSIAAKLVFDVPGDVKEPGFALGSSLALNPARIVIADEMHFLHKPTVVTLR